MQLLPYTVHPAPGSRSRFASLLLVAPTVCIVAVCSGAPLLWMIIAILGNAGVRSEFRFDAFRLGLLERTVGYNFGAAVIATAMGLPAAFVLGRGRGLTARLLWVILPSALIMPSLSYAYGWSQVLRFGLIHARAHGWDWMVQFFRPTAPGDIFRCIWSLGAWLWGVPAMLVGMSLRRMDTNVQQQAVLDGALLRTTLRQLMGPIIASVAIVTILATQEFAVYEPTGISVVATEMRMVFDTGALSSVNNQITGVTTGSGGAHSPDQEARAAAAVVTALPLVVVTVCLAIVAAWLAGKSSASDAPTNDDWPRLLDSSRSTLLFTLALLICNIGIPLWGLIHALQTPSLSNMWYSFGPQVSGSIFVAWIAASIACVLAFSVAARNLKFIMAITIASFLIGGQLLAIALIRLFNRPGLFWAYDIWVVPVVAYVGRFGWLAVAAGQATWNRHWRDIRDMAGVDGGGSFATAWHIVWPLAWPVLGASGLFVGALSLTEVPATVLLTPEHPQVLTPTLMTWLHMARYDPMIEASLIMMAAVVVPAVAAVLLTTLSLKMVRQEVRQIPRAEPNRP